MRTPTSDKRCPHAPVVSTYHVVVRADGTRLELLKNGICLVQFSNNDLRSLRTQAVTVTIDSFPAQVTFGWMCRV